MPMATWLEMTGLEILAWAALVLAAIPALLVTVNLFFYRPPRLRATGPLPAVSVLIPARDEEGSIVDGVESVLANRGVELEVVVMDDHSIDATADLVEELWRRDPRVRLEQAPPLPEGWCGKQHACWHLARSARHPVLVFLDADVRLAPDALERLVGRLEAKGTDLLSGIPRQLTGTWAEKLVVPLIHFILLGYLPMPGMRWSRSPAFAAGCGQLFAIRRSSYFETGGHASIRGSRHDGVTLPRVFRRMGLSTDLVDLDGLATCRMYRGAAELFRGFAKNATEGMAAPAAIGPWTLLLGGGQVLPFLLLPLLLALGGPGLPVALGAVLLAWGTRFALALRFGQSFGGALGHPLGIAAVLGIQYWALAQHLRGREIAWKGRGQVGALDPAEGT